MNESLSSESSVPTKKPEAVIEELRIWAISSGWAIGAQHHPDTGVTWYAWDKQADLPDCACNDKPPAIFLKPFCINDYRAVEFEIVGETDFGLWVRSYVYGVAISEVREQYTQIRATLRAAWSAMAASGLSPEARRSNERE